VTTASLARAERARGSLEETRTQARLLEFLPSHDLLGHQVCPVADAFGARLLVIGQLAGCGSKGEIQIARLRIILWLEMETNNISAIFYDKQLEGLALSLRDQEHQIQY
jgi:hypothetical protein